MRLNGFLALAVLAILGVSFARASGIDHDLQTESSKQVFGYDSTARNLRKSSGEERGIMSRLKWLFNKNQPVLNENGVKALNGQTIGTIPSNAIEKALSSKNIDKTLKDKNLQKVLSDKNLKKSLSGTKIGKVLSDNKIKRSTIQRVGAFLERRPTAVAAFKGASITTIVVIILILAFGSIGLASK